MTGVQTCALSDLPGVVPHYFVIKTMGDFAISNGVQKSWGRIPYLLPNFLPPPSSQVFVVVPALSEIIGRCLPMLGMVKHDNMRWVFATSAWLIMVAASSLCVSPPPLLPPPPKTSLRPLLRRHSQLHFQH